MRTDHRMTNEERDPQAAAGAEGTTDDTDAATQPELEGGGIPSAVPAGDGGRVMTDPDDPRVDGILDDAAEDVDHLTEGIAEADEESPPIDSAIAAAGAASADRTRARSRASAKAAPLAPSVSEQAVHINDRASAWFVIAIVGLFAAIFASALLFGSGGLVSDLLPTPTPAPTVAPSASPSASPSGSPSASASPVASPSAAPSASAGASPAASPSAAPSSAPSPSPSAS